MEFPKQIKDTVYRLLQEPTLDHFREFLQDQTGEHNAIDFKQEWIEKDKLAKLMLALANYGGGIVVFPRALAETMNESQLCIFKAKGSVFVTSDMPVVNIYGEKDGIEYDLLGMPITPELFLAFVDTVQRVPRIIIIDDNSVKRMNSKQINKDLLISNCIDLLSYIDFSIDAEKEDDEQVYQLLHTDKETALKQYEDMMSSKEIKYWR